MAGLLAYGMWGLFPLYFTLLDGIPALELTASRIVWTLVVVAIGIAVLRRWSNVRVLLRDRRSLMWLGLAGVLLAINWSVYVWAVTHGHVVDGALGYYINPLMTVVFGVVLLRERLSVGQWTALGIALVAVIVLTFDLGHPPWIALTLAGTFGCYGLIKKLVGAPALEGLGAETGVLVIPALVYLIVMAGRGESTFETRSVGTSLLLIGTGVITAVPLLLFSRASARVPLSTMGLMQYVTPTLQFICGVVILNESFPASRYIGFGLVWLALVILTIDGWRNRTPVVAEEA